MRIDESRRRFLGTTVAGTMAITGSGLLRPGTAAARSAADDPGRDRWRELDALIRTWWEKDLHRSQEAQIRDDADGTLLFLPFPYATPGGTERSFPEMYDWDTYFINRGMLAHGRLDLVADHIRDYLFMVERYGYMPNGNRTTLQTRSQTPVFPDSVWLHYQAGGRVDLLYQAYPLLKREYEGYWKGSLHQTPIGLATNRTADDPGLPGELEAEAETGLDWTPIFGGDARRCVPLITNCALVRYARVLALVANEVGRRDDAAGYTKEADTRAALIRKYCWDEPAGVFKEYDFVAGKQLPYISVCAYLTLWAGVATAAQARRLAGNLPLLEHPYGLTVTDKVYPNPHTAVSDDDLQFMYPGGWPPMHLLTVEGLAAYGLRSDAERIAKKWVDLLTDWYFNLGEQTETEGSQTRDSAPILTAGHTFGQRFTTGKPFSRVGGSFPTYNTTDAGFTLTLRRDDGSAMKSSKFTNVKDNAWDYLDLDAPAPAGTYVLEMSDPVGKIAWYSSSKDVLDNGEALTDGQIAPGDRTLEIVHVLGKGTHKLWEKYNVVDGNLEIPNARYGNMPMHGWTAASAVVLGGIAYGS